MTPTPLEFLRQNIGKRATHSPSPFMNWLAPVLESAEEGRLVFRHNIRPEMINPVGILHGGITAAIIDDAIGATLFSFGEEGFHTTLNLAVDYFASAKAGDEILAETGVLKKGQQVVNAWCEVWNADRSRLLAKGYSNLLKTEIRK